MTYIEERALLGKRLREPLGPHSGATFSSRTWVCPLVLKVARVACYVEYIRKTKGHRRRTPHGYTGNFPGFGVIFQKTIGKWPPILGHQRRPLGPEKCDLEMCTATRRCRRLHVRVTVHIFRSHFFGLFFIYSENQKVPQPSRAPKIWVCP